MDYHWGLDTTAAMMDAFCRHLAQGHGRSQALRLARADLRGREGWRHPYFWAPFILSGQWRTLSGDEPPVVAMDPPTSPPGAGGCACRSTPQPTAPTGLAAWLLALALMTTRRRRNPARR